MSRAIKRRCIAHQSQIPREPLQRTQGFRGDFARQTGQSRGEEDVDLGEGEGVGALFKDQSGEGGGKEERRTSNLRSRFVHFP